MIFKNNISYIVQPTRSQLQFITSFLIVKKYNQDAKVELFKNSRAKNNIHQRQN